MKSAISTSRDVRIDILRGYAMLTVALNHFGDILKHMKLVDWDFPTLSNYSYSSAAELFVFLSGYMVGLVYLRKDRAPGALIVRTKQLYLMSIYMFLLCALIAVPFYRELGSATGFSYFFAHPIEGGAGYLALVRQPLFLDVLQLYVLLMMLAASLSRPMIERPTTVLALSFGLYAAIQVSHLLGVQINVPGGMPEEDWKWNFNPFAWQFLFFLAMWAAQKRLLSRGFAKLERHRSICVLNLCLLAAVVVVYMFDEHLSANMPFVWKVNLQPVRLLNFFLMLVAAMSTLVLLARWLGSPLFSFLQLIGRNTLYCYSFSVPITYLLGLSATWVGVSLASCLCAAAILVLSMYVVAVTRERLFRSRPRPQFARP